MATAAIRDERQKRIEELEEALLDARRESTSLQASLDESRHEYERQQTLANQHVESLAEREIEVEDLRAQIDHESQQRREAEGRLISLKDQLSEVENARSASDEQLEEQLRQVRQEVADNSSASTR